MEPTMQGTPAFLCERALVIGAASGIGRAIADMLAEGGVSVAVADLDTQKASDVARGICRRGGRAEVFGVDVADSSSVDAMFGSLRHAWPDLDLLVNSFGILGETGPVEEISDAEWARMVAVNLSGVFHCCRAAVRWMKEKGKGRIINFSSVAALTPTPGALPYSTCKAGVVQLSKTLAREVAGHNLRVNVIAPGYVDTPMLLALDHNFKDHILRRTPLKRFALPEEIAGLVRFLASPEADFFTGQVLSPNGGLVM